jgi:hypothetical protein
VASTRRRRACWPCAACAGRAQRLRQDRDQYSDARADVLGLDLSSLASVRISATELECSTRYPFGQRSTYGLTRSPARPRVGDGRPLKPYQPPPSPVASRRAAARAGCGSPRSPCERWWCGLPPLLSGGLGQARLLAPSREARRRGPPYVAVGGAPPDAAVPWLDLGPAWRGSSVSLGWRPEPGRGEGGSRWCEWWRCGGCGSTTTVAGAAPSTEVRLVWVSSGGTFVPSAAACSAGDDGGLRQSAHDLAVRFPSVTVGGGWWVVTGGSLLIFLKIAIWCHHDGEATSLAGACCGAVVVLQGASSLCQWQCCGGGGVGLLP